MEGAEFHEGVIPVEGNAGPALLADEGLRVFGDEFQQLDVATVAGLVDGLGEPFVGLALFRVLLVEIRVKHPHQLLPKLFEPPMGGGLPTSRDDHIFLAKIRCHHR